MKVEDGQKSKQKEKNPVWILMGELTKTKSAANYSKIKTLCSVTGREIK